MDYYLIELPTDWLADRRPPAISLMIMAAWIIAKIFVFPSNAKFVRLHVIACSTRELVFLSFLWFFFPFLRMKAKFFRKWIKKKSNQIYVFVFITMASCDIIKNFGVCIHFLAFLYIFVCCCCFSLAFLLCASCTILLILVIYSLLYSLCFIFLNEMRWEP